MTEGYLPGITGTNTTCSPDKAYSPYDLNYPSFAAGYDTKAEDGTSKTVNVTRAVTSVGGGAGTYHASVSVNDQGLVQVVVDPEELTFAKAGETKGFVVSVTLSGARAETDSGRMAWGRLEWSERSHTVGSSMGFVWGDLAALPLDASSTASGGSRL